MKRPALPHEVSSRNESRPRREASWTAARSMSIPWWGKGLVAGFVVVLGALGVWLGLEALARHSLRAYIDDSRAAGRPTEWEEIAVAVPAPDSNAAPLVHKAARLFGSQLPIVDPDLPLLGLADEKLDALWGVPIAAVRRSTAAFLEKNSALIELLVRAGERAECMVASPAGESQTMAGSVTSWKGLADCMRLAARHARWTGDTVRLRAALKGLLLLCRSRSDRPALIDLVVSGGLECAVLKDFPGLVEPLSAEDLAAIDRLLAAPRRLTPAQAFAGERMRCLDVARQLLATSYGEGAVISSFWYARSLLGSLRYYDDELATLRLDPTCTSGPSAPRPSWAPDPSRLLLPVFARVLPLVEKQRDARALARVGIAVLEFRKGSGRLPRGLDELPEKQRTADLVGPPEAPRLRYTRVDGWGVVHFSTVGPPAPLTRDASSREFLTAFGYFPVRE